MCLEFPCITKRPYVEKSSTTIFLGVALDSQKKGTSGQLR